MTLYRRIDLQGRPAPITQDLANLANAIGFEDAILLAASLVQRNEIVSCQDQSSRVTRRTSATLVTPASTFWRPSSRPPGYAYEPRSHYAVAAAVAQKRADWGVTIETVAEQAGLRFRPLRAEHYDFAVPAERWERPALVELRRLLEPGSPLRRELAESGFTLD